MLLVLECNVWLILPTWPCWWLCCSLLTECISLMSYPFGQLVTSPVKPATQTNPDVWPVLQISSYMMGSAFRSAQLGISRVAMEDAEVRNVFTWLFLRLSAPCLVKHIKTHWDIYSKHCMSELLLLLVINTRVLLLSLVCIAHASWELSLLGGGGCGQQHSRSIGKNLKEKKIKRKNGMFQFCVLCFFVSLSWFMLHMWGTSGHSVHLLFLSSGVAVGSVPAGLWRGFLPGSWCLQG